MSTVQPAKQTGPLAYRFAKWAYQSGPNDLQSGITKVLGGSETAKSVGTFLKQQFNNDFCEFAKAEAGGRFKTLIAEPPRGALLFLLYPCTVGPRLYRAWQRGRKEHDYREMGDVLRRDLTAITFFVFALSPIVRGLSGMMQRASNVNLLERAGQVLRYSQFRNYELDTIPVLKGILAEGNGKGLQNAVESLSEHGLDKSSPLAEKIRAIKTAVKDLVGSYDRELAKGNQSKALTAIHDQADAVITRLKEAEALRKDLAQSAKDNGSKDLAKMAKNMQGEFTGALKKYAKVRRLPTDLVSFLAVVGLIGWFPVWFNSVWNKRQFEKEKAAKAATQASQPPVRPMTFNSFRAHSPYYPQQPMTYSLPQQPYGANPFAR